MTANERLADHFIKAAPIAAVYVDAAGEISAFDVVGFEAPPDGVLLCCAAGKQVAIVAQAAARIAPECGPDAALAALRAAAANAGVGLTPHRAVVRRALATVEMINGRITELQRTGGLRDVNAEFKAGRADGKGARGIGISCTLRSSRCHCRPGLIGLAVHREFELDLSPYFSVERPKWRLA